MPIIPISGSSTARGALVPIGATTLTSIASSIGFTNIPQIYQDLRLVFTNRTGNPAMLGNVTIYLNGTGATGWSSTYMTGAGSGGFSSTRTTNPSFGALTLSSGSYSGAGYFSTTIWDIFNYRGSNNKTVLFNSAIDLRNAGQTTWGVSTWANTAAVSAIEVAGTNLAIGTTATLYGVRSVGQ
jgi:hypothetical protein